MPSTSDLSLQEVFEKAADLFELGAENGGLEWTRGLPGMGCAGSRACLAGSVARVMEIPADAGLGLYPAPLTSTSTPEFDLACSRLATGLPPSSPLFANSLYATIFRYNDDPERNVQDVIDVLRHAAKREANGE